MQKLNGAFKDDCILSYYNDLENNSLCIGLHCTYDKQTFNLKAIELAYEKAHEKYNVNKDTDTGITPITIDELKQYITHFITKYSLTKPDKVFLFTLLDEKTLTNLLFIRNFNVYKDSNGSIKFYDGKPNNDIVIFDLYGWVEDGLNNKKQSAWLYFEVSEQLRNHILKEYSIDILNNQTPAKTGINIFRKNYINPDKPILPPNHLVRKQALLSNWGSVAIAFKRGIFKGNFNYYDAKSMYSSCAVEIAELPIKDDWIRIYDLEDL